MNLCVSAVRAPANVKPSFTDLHLRMGLAAFACVLGWKYPLSQ